MNAILILPVVLVLLWFARRERRDDIPRELHDFCHTHAGWRNGGPR